MCLCDKAGGPSDDLNINENRNKVLKRSIENTIATYSQNTNNLGFETGLGVNGLKFIAFMRGNQRTGILNR